MSTTEQDTRTAQQVSQEAIETADRLIGLRAKPTDERSDTWEQEVRDTSNLLTDLDREYEARSHAERHAIEQAAWDHAVANPPTPESRGPSTFGGEPGGETRDAGTQFIESDAYENRDANGQIDGVEVRNLLTGTIAGSSNSNLFAPVGSPFLAPQGVRQRRLFVRDLLSVQQTGLNSIPYIREFAALTNEEGATTVAEASAKPEVAMKFASADAPVRKIAAWIQVTMEALEDAPTLAGYINTRLGYMVLLREEEQVLDGNGTAPNISGITDQTAIQTQAGVANDVPATVGLAISKIENVDGFADGVAINPITFWTGVVERFSSQMDAQYQTGNVLPYTNGLNAILGLPAVRTRSLATGNLITGSWALGATLYERMGVTIRSTDSHASLFISNTVVVLAEERVALAIHRPDFFVRTTDQTFS